MSQQNSSKPSFVRLALTDAQQAQVRAETGLEAQAIELGIEALEERIAPFVTRHNSHTPT